MTISARPATLADIRQMAEVAGPPVTAQELADWMDGDSAYAAWHVAEDEAGALFGFQRVGRSEHLPAEACEIATFLARGPLPLAVGSHLFEATAHAARLLRYDWISAAVATENESARVYYQSHGFRVWNGTGARVFLRFDLD